MEIKILELDDRRLRCIIKDTTPAFMNSIRRVIINEIPKLAIHEVQFNLGPIRGSTDTDEMFESNTPLFNEIIAHRMGMLAIPTDIRLFNFKEECVCEGEGCNNCTVMYILNKQGPCTVYSGDLEPISGDASGDTTGFEIIDKLVPIVKLNEGQAILAYATAKLGRGKKHAKWQVCGQVGYQYFPNITIDRDICDNGGGCIDICHKDVLGYNTKGELTVNSPVECDLCGSCMNICVPQMERSKDKSSLRKAINVEGRDDMFIFNMITDGSYKPKEALEMGLSILEEKFRDLRTSVSGL